MQCRDDGHAERAEQGKDMTAGLSSKDPVLVLKTNDLDFVDIEEVRCLQILRRLRLCDFKPDGCRIGIVASAVVHCRDKAVQVGKLAGNGFTQICCECGDAALPRNMIA